MNGRIPDKENALVTPSPGLRAFGRTTHYEFAVIDWDRDAEGWGMATIDDARARLVAGQAAQLRDDARLADELLRRGKIDEARALVALNVTYARTIWHELDLLTRPPRKIPIRGKSRRLWKRTRRASE